jgi:Protein of unknown function (DUF1064)
MARKYPFARRVGVRRKFKNIPVTIDGFRFDSKKEGKRYGELRMLERAGLISCLECHPQYAVNINGQHYLTYTADFSYRDHKRGAAIVIEDVKSPATRKLRDYRLRKKAVELFHNVVVVEV